MTATNDAGPRSVALVGPFGSGKTTLLESLLYVSDTIHRKGKVPDGTSVGDASAEARARGSTVELNVASLNHGGQKLTLLDCPGSVEFSQETLNALIGVDLAIVVCDPDIDRVWTMARIFRMLSDNDIPAMLFANRMDESVVRVGELVEALTPMSSRAFVPCHVAIRDADSVNGYVDLISGQAHHYEDGAPSSDIEAPESVAEREGQARTQLYESLADFDDSLLESLLEDQVPGEGDLRDYLHETLGNAQVIPVLMGSAERDWGVRRLLDAVLSLGPSPAKAVERRGIGDGGPLAQVLKTYVSRAGGGKTSLVRVWRGSFKDGMPLSSGGRISGLYDLQGQAPQKIGDASDGDIVGFGRLDDVPTGTVLAAEGGTVEDLLSESILAPVYGLAVRAAKRDDEVKLSGVMSKLHEEDPSLAFEHNADTHEAVLRGQGEMHLKTAIDKLAGKYGLTVTAAEPWVAYKETIKKPVSQHSRHKKQSGGHGQFGDVHVDIKPLPRGAGFEFNHKVVGGSVPRQFISAVEAGVREFLVNGPLGFPVVDVSVTLTDGKHHPVDSSEQAFKTAGRMAMSEGMPKCAPVLLEPVAEVKISVPNQYTPHIQRLIPVRRGHLMGYEARAGWDGWDEITTQIPQADLHDLIIELRSLTLGVGSFESRFDHLQELSGRLADDVLAATAEHRAAS